jgi:hypothetical protein
MTLARISRRLTVEARGEKSGLVFPARYAAVSPGELIVMSSRGVE